MPPTSDVACNGQGLLVDDDLVTVFTGGEGGLQTDWTRADDGQAHARDRRARAARAARAAAPQAAPSGNGCRMRKDKDGAAT